MSYTPTAYALRYDGKWWVFVNTPNGLTARLVSAYVTSEGAEQAIARYGFRRIPSPSAATDPPTVTLNRGNTSPR